MPLIEELLRSYLRAGDAQDYVALAQALREDVVIHSPGGVLTRGLEANLAVWKAAHEGMDRLQHRVLAVVAGDVSVAARVGVTGTHTGPFLGIAPTGRSVSVAQALFARRDADRIVELWEIVDTGWGLQQLGVLGPQALSPGST